MLNNEMKKAFLAKCDEMQKYIENIVDSEKCPKCGFEFDEDARIKWEWIFEKPKSKLKVDVICTKCGNSLKSELRL